MQRVLCELVAEIVTNKPASRGPRVERPGLVAGLELLDLALNPDHIVRVTEDLAFLDAYTLRRSLAIDVGLDRISARREQDASQLWALPSERPREQVHAGDDGHKLWTPLVLVPRPVDVPIEIHDADGTLLPRPRASDVRSVLEAALLHMLRAGLRNDPDFDRPDTPLGRLVGNYGAARWTLQQAILDVCASGRGSAHSHQRVDHVLRRTGCTRLDQVDEVSLAGMVDAALHAPDLDDERRIALRVLVEKVAAIPAFMEIVDLVYGNILAIAGLDPARRDHVLHVGLPDVEALPEARDRGALARSVDFREHNFTALVRATVPPRVNQYRIQMTGSLDEGGRPETSLAVVALVRLEPRPLDATTAAIASCKTMLRDLVAVVARAHWDHDGTPRLLAQLAHLANQTGRSLDTLRHVIETQDALAADLRSRWTIVTSRRLGRAFPYFADRTRPLKVAIERASTFQSAVLDHVDRVSELRQPAPTPAATAATTTALADALDEVVAQAHGPHLDVHLAGENVPGRETGRVRVNRPFVAGAPETEARSVDVWATMSDHLAAFAIMVLTVPVGMLALLVMFGALVFESPWWLVSYDVARGVADDVFDRPADALAAVMLLIPGVAVSQIKLPRASSVRGKLRRAARMQVYTAVLTTAVCATVVAAEVDAGATTAELQLVLWVLRISALVFVAWIAWAAAAIVVRRSLMWIPKGFERAVVVRHPVSGGRAQARARARPPDGLRGLARAAAEATLPPSRKRADVEFDLRIADAMLPPRLRDEPT